MTLNLQKCEYWGPNIPFRPSELSYVEQVPLPISDPPKSARIKSRCIERMTILEPSKPDRAEVRKLNYNRRQDQMHNQGFVSLIQEPYKAIGEPIYLNSRQLIVNTLGLPSKDVPENDDIAVISVTGSQNAVQAVAPYILRRSKKQLNTLKLEMDHGRSLLRNVKLGHGLFRLLQDDWNTSLNNKELETANAIEKEMVNWKVASGESDSDGEMEDVQQPQEVENTNTNQTGTFLTEENHHDGDDHDHVRFAVRPESFHGTSSRRVQSVKPERLTSAPNRSSRHKGLVVRPYTPLHSNIGQKKATRGSLQGEALYRQLCALHWILKAMDIPETSDMTPIINCWELNSDRMGGSEIYSKKDLEDQRARTEARYNSVFSSSSQHPKWDRVSRLNSQNRVSSMAPHTRSGHVAFRSRVNSLTQANASFEENTPREPADPIASEVKADLSVIKEESRTTEGQTKSNDAVGRSAAAVTATAKSQGLLSLEEEQQMEHTRLLEEAAKLDSAPIERLSHKALRASRFIKPKNSKELQEFKASCMSSKLKKFSQQKRLEWGDVKEERALRLHDELDHHDKNRLQDCRNKFSAMSTSSSSFYRALKTMRLHSEHMKREAEKEKNKKQDQSKYAKWYEDVTNMVPKECASLWYITCILDKLCIFGITESFSKASEHKFTRVLQTIRSWEVCSPDIAAAVEFCRERIIEISDQDFEELFVHIFPSIERPKTAPIKNATNKTQSPYR